MRARPGGTGTDAGVLKRAENGSRQTTIYLPPVTLTLYLRVDDAVTALNVYALLFGAVERRCQTPAAGRIVSTPLRASVTRDGSVGHRTAQR